MLFYCYQDYDTNTRESQKEQGNKAESDVTATIYLGESLHILQDKWSHYKKGAKPYKPGDWKWHLGYYDNPYWGRNKGLAERETAYYLLQYNLAKQAGRILPAFYQLVSDSLFK